MRLLHYLALSWVKAPRFARETVPPQGTPKPSLASLATPPSPTPPNPNPNLTPSQPLLSGEVIDPTPGGPRPPDPPPERASRPYQGAPPPGPPQQF